MKHIFIINHRAGNGSIQNELCKKLASLPERFAQTDVSIYETKNYNDAFGYVSSLPEGEKRLYACGGDGTLREVANAVISRGRSDESVGVVPCGTGNDFVRSFTSPELFTDPIAQLEGEVLTIDAIKIDGEYCVNMANVGFDSNVAHRMTRYKKHFGKLSYQVALVAELFSSIKYPIQVEFDGEEPTTSNLLLLSVANGNAYGGGFYSSPKAILTDGLLDVCICKLISRAKFIASVGDYKKGLHLDGRFSDFMSHRRCKRMELRFSKPTTFCQDGEISVKTKAQIEVVPKILPIILPKGCEPVNK